MKEKVPGLCGILMCQNRYESCVSNGVKQGGVITPVMFNLYLYNLVISLKQSGLGRHINGTYMGALGYADAVTLTCPSLYGLN